MAEAARREQLLKAAFAVACRDGIHNLTVRAVAAEARVSHGLVLFHFGRKDRLLRGLLGWLIEATAVLHVSDDIARFPRVADRLYALLHQEMARLAGQPEHIRLFLEFWTMGAQHAGIRTRISAELARYRTAFRTVMADMPGQNGSATDGIPSEGLAAIAVSWIHGCAVQAMIDPEHFDSDAYLATVRRIVSQLV